MIVVTTVDWQATSHPKKKDFYDKIFYGLQFYFKKSFPVIPLILERSIIDVKWSRNWWFHTRLFSIHTVASISEVRIGLNFIVKLQIPAVQLYVLTCYCWFLYLNINLRLRIGARTFSTSKLSQYLKYWYLVIVSLKSHHRN